MVIFHGHAGTQHTLRRALSLSCPSGRRTVCGREDCSLRRLSAERTATHRCASTQGTTLMHKMSGTCWQAVVTVGAAKLWFPGFGRFSVAAQTPSSMSISAHEMLR
mmetsp:Transcript_77558/g.154021  ORF Transcript_77558/g.154021 Transcript_77558/m.154021 type:complete len:106 (-) Transcript_77558:212-529(-)